MNFCPKCLSKLKEDSTCLEYKSKRRDKLLIISVIIVCFLMFVTAVGLLNGGVA